MTDSPSAEILLKQIIERVGEVCDNQKDFDKRLRGVEGSVGKIEARSEVQDVSKLEARISVLERKESVLSGKLIVIIGLVGVVAPLIVSWIFNVLMRSMR